MTICVICADSYICRQLLSPMRSGSSMMAFPRMILGCFFSDPGELLVSSKRSQAWSHDGWAGFWGTFGKVQGLVSSMVRTGFTSILQVLFYKSEQVQDQPRFKWRESLHILMGEAENHIAKEVNTERGIIVAIFVNNLPGRLSQLCSLLRPKHLE